MSGEEAAAMTPEQRPKLFEIGFWQFCLRQLGAGKELENPLAMLGRQPLEARFHLGSAALRAGDWPGALGCLGRNRRALRRELAVSKAEIPKTGGA